MNRIHIITSSFYPEMGGMEESILRVARLLQYRNNNIVTIYVRNSYEDKIYIDDIEVVYICDDRNKLLKPLNEINKNEEKFRIDYQLLKNKIQNSMSAFAIDRHLILSFFVSSNGFLAQYLADELVLPHIASIRGSDLNAHSKNPFRFSSIYNVVKSATAITVTNNEHLGIINKVFNRYEHVSVIANSIPDDILNFKWLNKKNNCFTIFSDIGISFKKGTHILVNVMTLLNKNDKHINLRLSGNIDTTITEDFINIVKSNNQIDFLGFLSKEDTYKELSMCDVYCSPSLGEGCSNSRMAALSIGVPVITTDTGEVRDFPFAIENLHLIEAGNYDSLQKALESYILKFDNVKLVQPDIENVRMHFCKEKEMFEWENIIVQCCQKIDALKKINRPRLLFFVHDGTGLGHLNRLCLIAKELQKYCSCLIVSGHRTMSNMVPMECEFVHLPSLDSLRINKSRHWGRVPFLDVKLEDALELRNCILKGVVEGFKPQAIIVDFLPLGKYDELGFLIENFDAKKYFISRGVLDHPDNIRIDVFGGRSENALEYKYDKIFVAADKKICDISEEYCLNETINKKIKYCGYVSTQPSKKNILTVRLERELKENDIYVVCSAGGGMTGEKLIEECISLARRNNKIKFDIILGPRSNLAWKNMSSNVYIEDNIRFFKENSNLSLLHNAADIVINSAGYNSLVESMEGGARIIAVPIQLRTNDEQYIHPEKLKSFYPIDIVTDLSNLEMIFKKNVDLLEKTNSIKIREILDFNGIETIKNEIMNDLMNNVKITE